MALQVSLPSSLLELLPVLITLIWSDEDADPYTRLLRTSNAPLLLVPMTTLWGDTRSRIAEPSARNSGILTIEKRSSKVLPSFITLYMSFSIVFLISKAVPSGTVDFSTMIL
jgi:hypothetical protein